MFEITIKEIKTETKLTRGEHTVIEQRPFTKEELNNAPAWELTENGKQGKLKPIYGYAPDREVEVVVEQEILKQTVAKLDLTAVIRAINKI